jgi:hypothetical protein
LHSIKINFKKKSFFIIRMGAGQSNNYSERDFEEKPLEDEEIEKLLEELPSSDKLKSLTQKEKIKILKATSDEKIYNTVGDDIFDYYFTNNKETIKGCMKGHMNREGTPCPDEKFNRMITTMPNLVQGPLGKKETEWDTEKTALQNQLGELNEDFEQKKTKWNVEKQNLETKFNESNKERKDLKNKYSQLEKSKQESIDILVNQKNTLQSQYDEIDSQKGGLEDEIQKNLLSNVVRITDGNNIKTVSEQQCKAYAESLGTTMGKGNDTSGCYLAPHKGGGYGVYYNKKTGRGKCYYNSNSDYRKCIQNNLNRNNTYSKQSCRGDVGGEYDCRVDGTWDQITLKGWDRNKYGQTLDAAKHFCNTHKDCVAVASSSANWNWPVHTTSKFKPCHNKLKQVTIGKPDGSVSEDECQAYLTEISATSMSSINDSTAPGGCFSAASGALLYYNSKGGDCETTRPCIQKGHNCDPKMNYHTKRECKKPIDGVWTKKIGGKSCEWECPGRSGIEKYTVPKFHTNSSYACSAQDYTYDKNKKAHSGSSRKLVQGSKGHFSCRAQDNSNYGYTSYKHQDDRMTYQSSCSDWDNPAMFYKAVSTETVDINVGSSPGKTKVVDLPHKNMTVSNKPINSKFADTFEVAVSGTKLTVTRTDSNDGWGQNLVLRGTKENLPTVSEEECKAYADTHGYSYLVDNWDSKLKGCSIHTPTNRVFFNTHETGDGLNCGQGDQLCIQKQYYKVTGSGVCDKPEDIVPQNECKKAAKSLGFEYNSLGFGNKGEHAQSGCFMDGNILFHFDNKWKGDNYKKVGDYGGRTYLCKR